jgi:hypothetical protein
MSKRLVFLDIDGVLNDHTQGPNETYCRIDPEHAARFNALIQEADAQFVLSSAWRYLIHSGEMNLEGMKWLLRSHWIDGSRLVGFTRKDTMVNGEPMENERGKQITDWLDEHGRPDVYVAIDDIDLGISAAGHTLVQTDCRIGLTDWEMRQALYHLLNGTS